MMGCRMGLLGGEAGEHMQGIPHLQVEGEEEMDEGQVNRSINMMNEVDCMKVRN